MLLEGTIAALSSPAAPSARIILRLSGAESFAILRDVVCPLARGARWCELHIRGMPISAWVYAFQNPHSYTGEDLIELHLPGNPLLARLALQQIIDRGARLAAPGEFTARAFFNGRMDLSQAEGVAALVCAASDAELTAARRLLSGELARRLAPMLDELAQTLATLEAEIDFSDQDHQWARPGQLLRTISIIAADLQSLLKQSSRLGRLGYEPRVVLAGRPNAGKSSLLNALARQSRAVVSPVTGTTRDAISAAVALPRGMIRLVDIAGLENSAPAGEIPQAMQSRAADELAQADLVILLRDATDPRPPLDLPRPPDLRVLSKSDLLPACPPAADALAAVSALTGAGLDELRSRLDAAAFGPAASQTTAAELSLTARHVQAISAALDALAHAQAAGESAVELMAADVRLALDYLGQVLGTVWPDDILGRIFATFCMGK